jgi:regulator of sigma E protease
VALGLVTEAIDREPVEITVRNADGAESAHELDLNQLEDDFSEENTLEAIGLTPWRLNIPAIVGTVSPDSPATVAGIYPGDRIVRVNGEEVPGWSWVGYLVQKYGSEEQFLALTIERDGVQLEVKIKPRKESTGVFSSRLLLGVSNAEPDPNQRTAWERSFMVLQYGPVAALQASFDETLRLTDATFGLLGRMLAGQASVKNLSGPISIAQFANSSAGQGLSNFLFFLGAISLSLGILNLLPIPVLDGGHLMYYLIEWLKGSPVSQQAQMVGQYAGLVALAGLMSLAFINDILRLIG